MTALPKFVDRLPEHAFRCRHTSRTGKRASRLVGGLGVRREWDADVHATRKALAGEQERTRMCGSELAKKTARNSLCTGLTRVRIQLGMPSDKEFRLAKLQDKET